MTQPILVNVTEEIVRGLVSFCYMELNTKHFVIVINVRWI